MKGSELPKVSAIIPMRDEGKYIGKCLQSLLDQDYPQDKMEILAIDAMSTDNTKKIVKEYKQKLSFIKLLDNPNIFTPFAFNIGIKNSTGEIIIFMGAHISYSPNYISIIAKYLLEGKADCVGSVAHTLPGGNTIIAKAISLAMSSRFGVGNSYMRTGVKNARYVDTASVSGYKREVFDRIGFFDEELIRCQDDEFNYRLREARGKILLIPEIKSYYYARPTLNSLWLQYFRYGIWKVRVFQKHPRMMQIRQFVPSTFVLGMGGSLILSTFAPIFFWLFVAVILCYLAGSLFFSFKIAKQHSWKYFFVMPIVFATLHFSYGLGFLIGLLIFAGRQKKR
jgi:glycosyltransferase involved in cell wall biosynthesis